MPTKVNGNSNQITIKLTAKGKKLLELAEAAGIVKSDLIVWCVETYGPTILAQDEDTRKVFRSNFLDPRPKIFSFRATPKVSQMLEEAKKQGLAVSEVVLWSFLTKSKAYIERHVQLAKDLERAVEELDKKGS